MSGNARTPDARTCERESDAIQRFFQRPVFLSFTIGIPFCIFKLLFGLVAFRIGSDGDPALALLGRIILIWATADLMMNMGRSLFDLAHRDARFEYCTIAQMGRIFNKPLLFLALDTLVTFCIICTMLWLGWITKLGPFEIFLWYVATTMNLISLSLVALYNEMRNS